jgi:hypothetical protein
MSISSHARWVLQVSGLNLCSGPLLRNCYQLGRECGTSTLRRSTQRQTLDLRHRQQLVPHGRCRCVLDSLADRATRPRSIPTIPDYCSDPAHGEVPSVVLMVVLCLVFLLHYV